MLKGRSAASVIWPGEAATEGEEAEGSSIQDAAKQADDISANECVTETAWETPRTPECVTETT